MSLQEFNTTSDIDFCEHLEDIVGDFIRFIPVKNRENIYVGINELTPVEDNPEVIVKATKGQAYENSEFECLNTDDIEFVRKMINENTEL